MPLDVIVAAADELGFSDVAEEVVTALNIMYGAPHEPDASFVRKPTLAQRHVAREWVHHLSAAAQHGQVSIFIQMTTAYGAAV